MKIVKSFLAAGLLAINAGVSAEEAAEITVYRSPTCSCCEKWLAHLQQDKFTVKDIVIGDIQAIKAKYGVTAELASCHTAIINGYVIEGHVPAGDIRTLLKSKPKVVGIAVPGMPAGTPGMEMGTKKEAYDVVSFDAQHRVQVFNSYQGSQ
ncbi:MAG: DUF411 domain-containing protein [Methylovulum sp.]|nr:MAG: DUF411 domain-containing protein [Methylovulum sp.]